MSALGWCLNLILAILCMSGFNSFAGDDSAILRKRCLSIPLVSDIYADQSIEQINAQRVELLSKLREDRQEATRVYECLRHVYQIKDKQAKALSGTTGMEDRINQLNRSRSNALTLYDAVYPFVPKRADGRTDTNFSTSSWTAQ